MLAELSLDIGLIMFQQLFTNIMYYIACTERHKSFPIYSTILT